MNPGLAKMSMRSCKYLFWLSWFYTNCFSMNSLSQLDQTSALSPLCVCLACKWGLFWLSFTIWSSFILKPLEKLTTSIRTQVKFYTQDYISGSFISLQYRVVGSGAGSMNSINTDESYQWQSPHTVSQRQDESQMSSHLLDSCLWVWHCLKEWCSWSISHLLDSCLWIFLILKE